MPRTRDLPDDVETLKRLLTEKDAALEAIRGELHSHKLEIERLRLQLARLRRIQFGRSSEALNATIAQLELRLEELEAAEAAVPTAAAAASSEAPRPPVRRALPAHLPRETHVHPALPTDQPCACPECGGAMRTLGEDVSEMLEYAYLRCVLERIAEHPINRIDELLPWNLAPHLQLPRLAA